MLLTDVQPYNSDVLHLSISTKTYWWHQLLSNVGNLFVHLISLVEENNWTRMGPIDPISPISKTSLKPIY